MQSDNNKKQSTIRSCSYALHRAFRETLFENPDVGDMVYQSYLDNLPAMMCYARANKISPYEYIESISKQMQDEHYRYNQAQRAAAAMRRFRSYLPDMEK